MLRHEITLCHFGQEIEWMLLPALVLHLPIPYLLLVLYLFACSAYVPLPLITLLSSLPLTNVARSALLHHVDPAFWRCVQRTMGFPQCAKLSPHALSPWSRSSPGSLCALVVLEVHYPTHLDSIRAQEAAILDPMYGRDASALEQ